MMAACDTSTWDQASVSSLWHTVKVLALGQLLALLITGTGVTSELLVRNYSVALPATQSFVNYALLIVYLIYLLCTHPGFLREPFFQKRWWLYLLSAIIDVEANYVAVLAYQYTSITSVMLLDCFSIPVVMVGSRWVFGTRFRWQQLVGVGISLVGVILLVVADLVTGRSNPNVPNPALGDVLCLISATLYGCSNVMQEWLVKEAGQIPFLGMLAMFALPISAVQSGLLEGAMWSQTPWNTEIILLFAGFGACLFTLYSLVPTFLKAAGATPLNLSLLTSDFYSLLIGIFLFDFQLNVLYIFAFLSIICGVICFEYFPAVVISSNTHVVIPSSESEYDTTLFNQPETMNKTDDNDETTPLNENLKVVEL